LRDERGAIFGVVAFGVPANAHRDDAATSSPQRSIRTRAREDARGDLEDVIRMTERSLSIVREGPYPLLAYMLQAVLRDAQQQLKFSPPAAPAALIDAREPPPKKRGRSKKRLPAP
jgi:hypothetical protein